MEYRFHNKRIHKIHSRDQKRLVIDGMLILFTCGSQLRLPNQWLRQRSGTIKQTNQTKKKNWMEFSLKDIYDITSNKRDRDQQKYMYMLCWQAHNDDYMQLKRLISQWSVAAMCGSYVIFKSMTFTYNSVIEDKQKNDI